MSRQLQQKGQLKTRIGKFLAGDNVLLNSEEEKILARWQYAHDLLGAKQKTWIQIRDCIVSQFSVSKFTAENDISNAQDVFGSNRKINKRYLLHLHLDRINEDIERVREKMFYIEDDKLNIKVSRAPDSKEIAALAKLNETYTYTLNSIPDESDRIKLPPPIFVFKLPDGVSITQPMSFEEAMKGADEYIDYDVIQPNNEPRDLQSPGSTSQGEDNAGATYDDPVDTGE